MPRRDLAEAVDLLWRVRGATPRLGFWGLSCGEKQGRRVPRQGARMRRTRRSGGDRPVQQQILEIAEKWRTMAAFEEKFER